MHINGFVLKTWAAYRSRIHVLAERQGWHFGSWDSEVECRDDHDLGGHEERFIDLAWPLFACTPGSIVRLKLFVIAGVDLVSDHCFVFRPCSAVATYHARGSFLQPQLQLDHIA